ncbi:MPN domain-containing protein (plasmid) [Rhizobium etli bv. mimosae str. Mim1]|nr:MPN domain-containing protein [Rhizobium etli bv. mimosae str. Mim1]
MGPNAFVLLPARLVQVMRRFTVGEEGRAEAGGILIGSQRGDHIEISNCTTPLRRDVRKPYLFDRKDRGHQLAAMSAWTRSLGKRTFVGEWHTHPEDDPVPSGIDRATWRDITMKNTAASVFIIFGRKTLWAGIGQAGSVTAMKVVS